MRNEYVYVYQFEINVAALMTSLPVTFTYPVRTTCLFPALAAHRLPQLRQHMTKPIGTAYFFCV
jgi:hypothetical protein